MEALLSLTRRQIVSLPSKLKDDQGMLVAALSVGLVFPEESEDGDSCAIRQKQSKSGQPSRSFQSHAWGNTVV